MQENKEKGTILKEARIKKGLTQEQLAQSINYTRQYISKWENNMGFPKDIHTLRKLSDLLSIPLEKLVTEDYLVKENSNETLNTEEIETKNKNFKYILITIILEAFLLISIIIYVLKTNVYMINSDNFMGMYSNNFQKRYLEIHSKETLENFNKLILYTYDESGRKDILSSTNVDNMMQEKIFVNSNEYNLKSIAKCGLFGTIFYKDDKLANISFLLNGKDSSELRTENKCKISEIQDDSILLKYGFKLDNNDYIYIDKHVNIYYDGTEFEVVSNSNNEQYSLTSTDEYGFYYYNLVIKDKSNDMKLVKYDATKDCSIEKCNTFRDYAEFINLLNKVLEYDK